MYKDRSQRIQDKVNNMKKYEIFLEKVKDDNQDEFSELLDIVSRYKQLSNNCKELQETEEKFLKDLEQRNQDVATYLKDAETEKITINNRMGTQQADLEKVDQEKNDLLNQRDENTKLISQQTTETGKMLFTINNTFEKLQAEKEIKAISYTYRKEYDESKHDETKNFDKTLKSANKAIEQLRILTQVINNFHELKVNLIKSDSAIETALN
jgi:chromosome segregation ATPase